MKKKLLATLALTCALTAGLGLFAACGETETPEKTPLAFVEGYVDEIELGESLLIREYVDTSVQGYTLVATMGDQTVTLTGRATWSPEDAGVWTLTYTVGEESVQATITIKAPPITWTYTATPIMYEENQTIEFASVFEMMNFVVQAAVDYEIYMDSVIVNNQTTDLKGQTTFTFDTAGIYSFRFALKSVDGQELYGVISAAPAGEPETYWIKNDSTSLINTYYINSAKRINTKPEFASAGTYSDEFRFLTTRRSTAFSFRKGAEDHQINNVFKAANVAAYSFDVFNGGQEDVSYAYLTNVLNLSDGTTQEPQAWGTLKAGEWTTVTLTKAQYETLEAENGENFIVFEVWISETPTAEFPLYMDNFRPVDADGNTVTPEIPEEEEKEEVAEPQTYYVKNDSKSLINTFYMNSATAVNDNAAFASVGTYSDKWRFLTTRRSTAFGFRDGTNEGQLKKVFEDTEVTGYSFDIYNAGTEDVSWAFVSAVKNLSDGVSTLDAQGTLKAGEWTTVTLTRAQFEALVAENGAEFVAFEIWVAETPTTEFALYLDNFRAVKATA